MNALVRQIAVLSVLWAMCELLLPDGKHRHVVRMTASLLVMAALVSTAGGWIQWGEAARPAISAAVHHTAEDTYLRTALTAMANQAKGYCERLAHRAGYEARAEVYLSMSGALEHVQLVLKPLGAPLAAPEELAAMLAGQLGAPEERIRISVEEP